MGISFNEVFKKIKDLCIKTLMSVGPEIAYLTSSVMKSGKYKGKCFEVYGFDVIIDQNYRPWLLEINVAPSLSSSSPYDKMVKTVLLSDTLHLAGFNIFDRKHTEEERKKERSRFGPGVKEVMNNSSIISSQNANQLNSGKRKSEETSEE